MQFDISLGSVKSKKMPFSMWKQPHCRFCSVIFGSSDPLNICQNFYSTFIKYPLCFCQFRSTRTVGKHLFYVATYINKTRCCTYFKALFVWLFPTQHQYGCSAMKKWRAMLDLFFYFYLDNEGASVFLFVHQAEGISRLPPDSHCCNWVVGTNTTVPAKALGNLHATKALFYSTFHMMSKAQMWQRTKCNQLGKGGEIIVCPRGERERKSFHQAKQVCARQAWGVTESAAHGQGSQRCCFQISFYLSLLPFTV